MTFIQFSCDSCNKEMEAESSMVGKQASCPNCGVPVTIPVPSIEPGMTIGDFTIEKRLGQGAMGQVWLAEQRSMGRKIALKILNPELLKKDSFIKRFQQEVKIAGKLLHPNIVTAFHAGEDSGIHYLAVSYVQGLDLETRLKAEKLIPEAEALEIIREVAEGLSYAWGKFQLVHRDIKPANIIQDNDGISKIMDLGISRCFCEEESNLTMTGVALGTPHYISPEQAKDAAKVDFRADIYSLGGTLFHLLSGKTPYAGNTAMEVIAKHLSELPPMIVDDKLKVSASCKELLQKMMAKKVEDRHQSWSELLDDIDRVVNGLNIAMPIALKPADSALIIPKRRGKMLRVFAMLIAFLVVATISGVISNKLQNRAEPAEDGRSFQGRERSIILWQKALGHCEFPIYPPWALIENLLQSPRKAWL